MKTTLSNIRIKSIYNGPLPARMAKCTPDMLKAISSIDSVLQTMQGELVLSDLFRSYDMQLQAHLDYVKGRKKAYSPPPGGSMHEAGRAFDLDLRKLGIPLAQFWDIAAEFGVFPIISKPNPRASEAWHFDCPGSHRLVYEYYRMGNGNNLAPYRAMAASGICSLGIKVDFFGARQAEASLQFGLIRLGKLLGNVDGIIGSKTKAALHSIGLVGGSVPEILESVEKMLAQRFPQEF